MVNKENMVYITAMKDALKNKLGILEKIFDATRKQEIILAEQELDTDRFDEILDIKDILVRQLLDLDQGFQGMYNRVEADLKKNKTEYKPQILEMQNLIRQNTDLGVKIQALEQRNKQRFDMLAGKKRQEIQEYRLNSRSAGMYARQMETQYPQGQGYFLDKRK